ncbi:hypothetical protein QNH14_04495 [Apirhabdus apintestini]|nr:hypothetical protein QNH14_04495 [Enterobacteriaceae bacterium CA-0114]
MADAPAPQAPVSQEAPASCRYRLELSVQALSSRAGISGIAIRISQLFFHTVCHLLYRLISALFFDPELRLLPRQRLCLLCTVLRPLRLPFSCAR